MEYKYLIYGITVISTIELPALKPSTDDYFTDNPIRVSLGKMPEKLKGNLLVQRPNLYLTDEEMIIKVINVANYYVSAGERIVLEPLCNNMEEVLVFAYNHAMTALLLQRDIIPLHVSGVFTEPGKVLLFGAPSGTGKSTTAIMLGQKGYRLFTDDTAMLTFENNQCFARASYPQTRLWQNVVDVQVMYDEKDKKIFKPGIEKYSFSFADDFTHDKVEVVGIVFLSMQGHDITIEKLDHIATIQNIDENIFGRRFIHEMKKNRQLFLFSMQVANSVSCWKATRPEQEDSFHSFADAIVKHIIDKEFSEKV